MPGIWGNEMHISSDTRAKINVFAVILIVVVGGAVATFGAFMLLNNRSTETYEITVEVTAVEVSTESGSVYNICMDTVGGEKYFNPETGKYDISSPSGKAILYVSATIGGKEKFSDRYYRDVQTVKEPVVSETVSDSTIKFRLSTSSESQNMTVFLMIRGISDSVSSLGSGTVADIFNESSGQSGLNISVKLKEGVEERTLIGNSDSEIIGLLRMTITTKVI